MERIADGLLALCVAFGAVIMRMMDVPLKASGTAAKIVKGARLHLTGDTRYDPACYSIAYPKGDLPKEK